MNKICQNHFSTIKFIYNKKTKLPSKKNIELFDIVMSGTGRFQWIFKTMINQINALTKPRILFNVEKKARDDILYIH